MTTRYDKLVRDQIPKIIERNDETPVTHHADDEEYESRLHEKLSEEATEFEQSGEIEELADVLEVVYTICDSRGVSWDTLEERRREKADVRGGFSDRVILERVE